MRPSTVFRKWIERPRIDCAAYAKYAYSLDSTNVTRCIDCKKKSLKSFWLYSQATVFMHTVTIVTQLTYLFMRQAITAINWMSADPVISPDTYLRHSSQRNAFSRCCRFPSSCSRRISSSRMRYCGPCGIFSAIRSSPVTSGGGSSSSRGFFNSTRQ